MRHRLGHFLLLAGLLLCLSGCGFQNTDDLFAIPRTSTAYLKLQDTIKEEIGNAESISPLNGANTQTIQLVDLDHDGQTEAIAFFRDNSAERPLKIAIFKQTDSGDYVLYSKIEGIASEIESIEYLNLVDDHRLEILVSWQATPQLNTLVAYQIEESRPPEQLMRSGYTQYLAFDINEDRKAELLLLNLDSDNSTTNSVSLYMESSGILELNSSAPLSSGIVSLESWESAYLQDKVPAFMVTSKTEDSLLLTDIFVLSDSGLQNITLKAETQRSEETVRNNTGITVSDFNNDGITEIPKPVPIPSNKSDSTDKFWKTIWHQFNQDGEKTEVASTYHNNTDRWYLILPEEWNDVITLKREDHVSRGERAVEFSYWPKGSDAEPKPFLIIYLLTGADQDAHALQNGRFILAEDSEVTYAAEFLPSNWNCGIDQYDLRALFKKL